MNPDGEECLMIRPAASAQPFVVRFVRNAAVIAAALSGLLLFASPASAATTTDLRARAETGDAQAQMTLGMAFYRGDDVPADMSQAVAWVRKAADQGFAPAEATMAMLYADGAGVRWNQKQSATWLRRAARPGLPQAEVALGKACAEGRDGKPDARQA